ncbi:MAG TPA: hypothetical protein PLB73_16360, partial [Leptospiraceae bacterium]|nr:hypothetical protein [Leptospiraceae bacterium]
AIRKCIGEQVAARSGVADGQSIASEIFTQAQGLCRDGEIMSQDDTQKIDNVAILKLQMRYTVEAQALNKQIDTMQQLAGNPKIMVLIREEITLAGQGKQIHGFTDNASVSASALRGYLESKHYSLIPPSNAGSGLNEEAIAENPAAVSEDLKSRAAKAGADVLIIGQVETVPQTGSFRDLQGTGLKSYQTTGTLIVLSLWGNGKILGEFPNTPAGGAQTSELGAAQASARRFAVGAYDTMHNPPNLQIGGAAKWVNQLLAQEWARVTRANELVLHIKGLDSRGVALFQTDLEGAGATKTDPQNITENTATIEVVYPGRSFALAETLSFYAQSPRFAVVRQLNKKIVIEKVDRGVIDLRFDPI